MTRPTNPSFWWAVLCRKKWKNQVKVKNVKCALSDSIKHGHSHGPGFPLMFPLSMNLLCPILSLWAWWCCGAPSLTLLSPGSQLNLLNLPSAHHLLQHIYSCSTPTHHQITVSDTVQVHRLLKSSSHFWESFFCVFYTSPLQPATLSPQPLSTSISTPLHLHSLVGPYWNNTTKVLLIEDEDLDNNDTTCWACAIE